MKYDILIVGSGFYGSTLAYELNKLNKKVLVIEKRGHIGGNAYDEEIEGIKICRYGPHYFNTNSQRIWNYINKFDEFYPELPKVKVNYNNKLYSFPINLNTLNQLWGVRTPKEASDKINSVKLAILEPRNAKEYILSQVGEEIYNIFYKNYTIRHWGKDPSELPISIVKRIPIRFNDNDNYHDSKFKGIPIHGYTHIFNQLLANVEVMLNFDFMTIKDGWQDMADKLIYSGNIDSLFDYKYGKLEYRSLRFETKIIKGDFQGNAQINYTGENIPFNRIIEHKHILPIKKHKKTVVTWEYPENYDKINEPFYPINDKNNNLLYKKYFNDIPKNTLIGGRLGKFQYLNMDSVIAMALKDLKSIS